jgi:hypothetical protein
MLVIVIANEKRVEKNGLIAMNDIQLELLAASSLTACSPFQSKYHRINLYVKHMTEKIQQDNSLAGRVLNFLQVECNIIVDFYVKGRYQMNHKFYFT